MPRRATLRAADLYDLDEERASRLREAEEAYAEAADAHNALIEEIDRYTRQMETRGSADLEVAVNYLDGFISQLEELEERMNDAEDLVRELDR